MVAKSEQKTAMMESKIFLKTTDDIDLFLSVSSAQNVRYDNIR